MQEEVRHTWSLSEVSAIYKSPLMELMHQAAAIHQRYHKISEVQVCKIVSFKTGGCPEDCKYCAQSSRYKTSIQAEPMLNIEETLKEAKIAVDRGATRICLGAAWREVRDSKQFDQVLEMVKGITKMGAEVCCTMGMLKEAQAKRLAEAGLYAYNHNLDTSRAYYPTIITTRTYDDRLQTLDVIEQAKISVCCGGILGLGESEEDRIALLHTLATRNPHPESVPLNLLVPVPGTPLGDQTMLPIWELIRAIATARIVMPKAMVRLSAGRNEMTLEQQALCFLAGANAFFTGEKFLTTALPNRGYDADDAMLHLFGMKKRPAFVARDPRNETRVNLEASLKEGLQETSLGASSPKGCSC